MSREISAGSKEYAYTLLANTEDILNQGKDLNNFLWEIIKYIKDVLIYKSSGKLDLYSEEEINGIKNIADKVTKDRLVYLIYELSDLENSIKWSTQKTIMFQAGIIKLCNKEEKAAIQPASNSKSSVINVNTNNAVHTNYNEPIRNNLNTSTSIPKASTAIKNDKIYSSDLNKSWPKMVNDLRQSGKIVLYTNLVNTKAEQIDDNTVEIKFQKGITAFGKTVLEKQENINEISNLVSQACGKDIRIKYVSNAQNQISNYTPQDDIQKLAQDSEIPFNIIE